MEKGGETFLIFGASGETGSQVLKCLLNSSHCAKAICIVRRSILQSSSFCQNDKLAEFVVPDLDEGIHHVVGIGIKADIGVCCLGTTLAKSDKEEFVRIERNLSLKCAALAKRMGCKQFHHVSGFMSHPQSIFFVPRVKGEAEKAIESVAFARLVIYRPGLLKCERKESRPMEAVARAISKWTDVYDWWSVEASDVARVIVHLAIMGKDDDDDDGESVRVLEHREIVRIAWEENTLETAADS